MNSTAPEKILSLALVVLFCVCGVISGLTLILLKSPPEKAAWLAELASTHLEQAASLPEGEEKTGHLQNAEKSLLLALEQTPLEPALWRQAAELYARAGQPEKAGESRKILSALPLAQNEIPPAGHP